MNTKFMPSRSNLSRTVYLLVLAIITLSVALAFQIQLGIYGTAETLSHDVRPGYGVTHVKWLSEYHSPLRNTPGDSPIYRLEGEENGGTALILGGTHPNEIAGVLAAVLMVEQSKVSMGTVYVVPNANNSASSYPDPRHDVPEWIKIKTDSTARKFRYGARYTNPKHQREDPEKFQHYPSGFELKGKESRNLNRVHPGKEDGSLTQQISHALFELVETESVDVVIDMHEASPNWRLANSLICHPDALEIGTMAKMNMELEGTDIKIEQSRPADKFHGLSHREFGDNTEAYAFLIESRNPGQGDVEESIEILDHPEFPVKERVKFQLTTINHILTSYNSFIGDPARKISLNLNIDLTELDKSGLSKVLR
ncbi:succinylglutamate desuccinylase/aspartoacylase family protein [Candidatus Bipolaricaulota bacterium]|nr:succinylglutamate desuccinylase/aspartoacylase family protein [Candidatus Bipolaricaulota bacterium]